MDWKDLAQWVQACGIFLAFWQLWLMKRRAVVQFEDNVNREYRRLAARLPAEAMLGGELPEGEYQKARDQFIHYIDLCNEQVFLRQCRRISRATWKMWCDGIRANLRRPAFARAWCEIRDRSGNFEELRLLVKMGFRVDPASREWRRALAEQRKAAANANPALPPTAAAIAVSPVGQSCPTAPASQLQPSARAGTR
jgi:hypothetical protein